MWIKIHVELEFHHFQTQLSSSLFFVAESFFVLGFFIFLGFFICWVSSSSSNRFSFFFFVLRRQIWRPDCASSNRLFVLPLQIKSCLFKSSLHSSDQIMPLQPLQIVLPLFFFRYDVLQVQNRVFKTRDLCGIILPTHQVGIKSLTRVLDWNLKARKCVKKHKSCLDP